MQFEVLDVQRASDQLTCCLVAPTLSADESGPSSHPIDVLEEVLRSGSPVMDARVDMDRRQKLRCHHSGEFINQSFFTHDATSWEQ